MRLLWPVHFRSLAPGRMPAPRAAMMRALIPRKIAIFVSIAKFFLLRSDLG